MILQSFTCGWALKSEVSINNHHFKRRFFCLLEPYFLSKRQSKKPRILDENLDLALKELNAALLAEYIVEKEEFNIIELPLAKFCNLSEIANEDQVGVPIIEVSDGLQIEITNLFKHEYKNKLDCDCKIEISNNVYFIPKNSTFMISEFKSVDQWLFKHKFDLILMDPPWFNSSASRSSTYKGLDCFELLKLPIDKYLNDDGYLAIWVTNNSKYQEFVTKKLFPKYGLNNIIQAIWLKVTTKGIPVMPISSQHRKPYEYLYIGCRHEFPQEYKTPKVLISVPSSNHSQKPFLDEIFDLLCPKPVLRLELFARMVRTGWTSWGNEVLKFNDSQYFEEIP